MTEDHEATIELDRSGSEPKVWLTLPRQSFTLAGLRHYAAYLITVADENEPSDEVEELARILANGVTARSDHRAEARALLAAGYRRGETGT